MSPIVPVFARAHPFEPMLGFFTAEPVAYGGLGKKRFGIVTTTTDGNGQFVYFDDLQYTARH